MSKKSEQSIGPVLVTGGAGFIGTHLCRRLVADGISVRVLDLVDPTPERRVTGVEYLRGDVRKEADLERALAGVKAVFHFAAVVSVPQCQEQPVASTETNVLSVVKILDRMPVGARFIFSGSSVVYGESKKRGAQRSEKEIPSAPLSFYGAQKTSAEHLIRLACLSRSVPSVVFRFFNVYGEGQDPRSPYSGVISIFAKAIQEGNSLQLNGGGKNTRDFVSVLDVAEACRLALTLPAQKCDGSAINLGSGRAVTIRELAEKMMNAAGKKVDLRVTPARVGDIAHSRAAIKRAAQVLGWKPRIKLEDGLRELVS